MNTPKLPSKRILIPTIVAVLAIGIGGVVWASTASADLEGNERDRVASAATEAVGGGKAVSVETGDDRGEAYEVEVRKADGTEVDVKLAKNLDVISEDRDDRDEAGATDDDTDAGDRALSSSEKARAEQAATSAVAGGTVTDVEASDDPGEAYEVDLRKSDGTEWDVTLDSEFKVLDKHLDD